MECFRSVGRAGAGRARAGFGWGEIVQSQGSRAGQARTFLWVHISGLGQGHVRGHVRGRVGHAGSGRGVATTAAVTSQPVISQTVISQPAVT